MSLWAKSKSKGIWNRVVKKCEKKLVSWKSQYLSLGGRLILINSVLDAMPTYMMSLFPMHASVVKRLDVLRKNFMWQGNNEKNKIHLVRWDILTTSKKEGGMGIRNLKIQNQGLMMKWLWRFSTTEQSLWKNVIKARYGMGGSWTTNSINSPYGVSLWRSIRKLWPKFSNKSNLKVGN